MRRALSVYLVFLGVLLAASATGFTLLAQASLGADAGVEPVAFEASSSSKVFVVPIEGMIDMGLGPMVDRVLTEAEEAEADLVVLEINTFGGRVDAAVAIRDRLLRSRVPTVAFINKRAISAGALISLAAERIAIASGGTIGAATPVQLGQEGSSPTDEKTVSYVRKEFRATADARGRPGMLAEAMVDVDVEIEGIIDKGKLLVLTTEEALQHGIADLQADSLDELLLELGYGSAQRVVHQENWAEHVLRFLTHPMLASLLMTVALLGIVIELRTPGFGVPGIVGLLSLAAFFWGHWLVELVGWEQVILVLTGLVLLALEVFVFPGFGVAGIAGIVALVAGLSSSLFGAGATPSVMVLAVFRVAIAAALALVGSIVLGRFITLLPFSQRLVLATKLGSETRPGPEPLPSLTGVVGKSLSPLRPAGIALLAGRRVDVVSVGDFIEAGETVFVVRDEGTRVVVDLHSPAEPSSPTSTSHTSTSHTSTENKPGAPST